MAEVERKYPYVDMHEFNYENLFGEQRDSFIKQVQEATRQALAESIKANSIVINENMVRVNEGPEDRLSQFESIGMEPDELRKAAELYRKVKEVME